MLLINTWAARADSALNIGLLGKLDDISVRPVVIGRPLGLRNETWRSLFAGDSRGAEALAANLASEITQHLRTGGLKVDARSKNEIWVSIYGGSRMGGSCALNAFLLEVWVSEGESSAMARAIVSEATDAELSDKLKAAALEIVDELVSLRARYRGSLKAKP